MKKIMLTILLAVSTAVCLSACGFGSDSDQTAGPKSASEEQNAGSTEASSSEDNLSDEEVEVMEPDGPIEEMEPQESVEMDMEEGLEGTF